MQLPDYERVIYKRNPLIEVVCQLRFPTILRINNQQPVDFQEEIRFDYPVYENTKSLSVPSDLTNLVEQFGLPLNLQETVHRFKSENLQWQLSLSQNYIMIATTEYERYEEFRAKFKKALEIFEKIYNSSFYSRVGLKYRDLIIRSNLNIKDTEWTKLIPTHIASELYTPEFSDSIETLIKNLQIVIDGGKLAFNHGLVMAQDQDKGIQEQAYLIDSDFYIEGRITKEDVWNTIDKFKYSAGRFFRWCITDELHKAMEPTPIQTDINQAF